MSKELVIKGIPVLAKVAMGKVVKIDTQLPQPSTELTTSKEQKTAEIKKVEYVFAEAKREVDELIVGLKDKAMKEIFKAHYEILDDPTLIEGVISNIDEDNMNAEMALHNTLNNIADQFDGFEDEYMRERAADIRDEYARLICISKGVKRTDFADLPEGCIVVAKDLAPSETAMMNMDCIGGFAIDLGGLTSHTSIMAQSAGIAAIVGCVSLFDDVSNDDTIILDGHKGVVIVSPSESTLSEYRSQIKAQEKEHERLSCLVNLSAVTMDGKEIELSSNAGNLNDVVSGKQENSDGIGLYRSEFLYMDSKKLPTEEEQFEAYKAAISEMDGRPVIIRTLDIGGDKDLPYMNLPKELNPFLGFRAIRICLERPDMFKAQLRAILRASTYGKARIMFPMISTIEEIKVCKKILQVCKNELEGEKVKYDHDIEVGIMVETPAAVLMADIFIKEVDFFSIGTNDLTQYLLCVDRGNEQEGVRALYSSYHPSVLRAIKAVIEAAHGQDKWVGMCGSFAGDVNAVKLLIGLGLDEFSVSSPLLRQCKEIIRETSVQECKEIADRVIRLSSKEEVLKALNILC
ncbi:MAG: phosphoenolpyruvate--protein phosphotransferase [Suipraeoptans sp.]